MGRPAGFEPATAGFTFRSAAAAPWSPLDGLMVGVGRFELPISCSRSRRIDQAFLHAATYHSPDSRTRWARSLSSDGSGATGRPRGTRRCRRRRMASMRAIARGGAWRNVMRMMVSLVDVMKMLVQIRGVEPRPPAFQAGASTGLAWSAKYWRPVRESNPRLPPGQGGTLATELTDLGIGGGGCRNRTDDLLLAKQTLYQLS
jgi:hypothetical protein